MASVFQRLFQRLSEADIVGEALARVTGPRGPTDATQRGPALAFIRRRAVASEELVYGAAAQIGAIHVGGRLLGANLVRGDVAGSVRGVNLVIGDVRGGNVRAVNILIGDVYEGHVRGVNILVGNIRGGEVQCNVVVGDIYAGRVQAEIVIGHEHGGAVDAEERVHIHDHDHDHDQHGDRE